MTVDVCLVLEGTYPFVTGGVSSWVHRLVSRLDHLTFRVLHLSPGLDSYPNGYRYELPENVLGVDQVVLQPDAGTAATKSVSGSHWRDVIQGLQSMMADMRRGRSGAFREFFESVNHDHDVDELRMALLNSLEGWEVMLDTYNDEAQHESLRQFFWTWRFALLPLLNVLTAKIPDARCYHTVCTGYAGILAAGAKIKTGSDMILTEHGIYAKERRIDIQRATWIPETPGDARLADRAAPYFKRFWMRQFAMMSRVCYRYADEIFTLYEGNKKLQLQDGADPDRLRVVPNGINLERFQNAGAGEASGKPERPFTIGFIGRVCPIKDVRTLLRMARHVADEIPDVRVRIMGPYDEDPEYAEQCMTLARIMRLQDNVAFEGSVNVVKELPTLDICVLSSISEAQPLVILEAGAFGVPTIGTDVGACSELLAGRIPEDRALGEGGRVVPITSPGALAEAVLEVARDPALRARMGRAMSQRVERYYDEEDMVRRYGEIYERHTRRAVTRES